MINKQVKQYFTERFESSNKAT